jgi:transposase InsO family protein
MKLHGNAELSLNKRRRLVGRVDEDGWTLTKAAEAAEVSVHTARKWVRRYRVEGEPGLLDRSSRPYSPPNATPEQRVGLIAALRRSTRMTGAEIAETLAMPITTVEGILTRIGLGRLSRLDHEQVVRYERSRPGELVHIDVKKLGRIEGGASHRVTGRKHYTPTRGPRGRRPQDGRLGVLPRRDRRLQPTGICRDPRRRASHERHRLPAPGAVLLRRPRGSVERVMTDNGSAYISTAHAIACRALHIKHLRTRPRRPQTNGKAERFIRTMLGGWAYGRIYGSSRERRATLAGWLEFYNHSRPHGALGRHPPLSRLGGKTTSSGLTPSPSDPRPSGQETTLNRSATVDQSTTFHHASM